MTFRYVIKSLLKNPSLNFIKIAGLSLSLSCILLIALYIRNEVTYDRYHKAYKRIYRFTVSNKPSGSGKQFARVSDVSYIPLIASYFPEIQNYVRLVPVRGGVMKYNDHYVTVNQAFECDSTFFEIFDAGLESGNPDYVLKNPGSVVISENFAGRVFGSSNPIGQILTLPAGQFYGTDYRFTVTGIMKDFPQKSHFHPEFITAPLDKNIYKGWAWVYLLLSDKADPGKIIAGFRDFYSSHVENDPDTTGIEAHLQRLSDIHLYSDKLREIEPNGNIYVIYALSFAGLILLIIALENYANLNMAMAAFSEKYLFMRNGYAWTYPSYNPAAQQGDRNTQNKRRQQY